MKTLQIGLEWFPERAGGLPRYYYDLFHASSLYGIGFRGLVAGSSRVAADTEGAIEAFASSDSAVLSRLLAARAAIKHLIADYDPDIVVSHFALHTVPALHLIKQPLVVHFHGPWALESATGARRTAGGYIKHLAESVVYREAARFIVLSRAFGLILHKTYDVPLERICVVPGATNVDRFDIPETLSEAREHMGWPTDRPIILAVRRLVSRMGLENLIHAIGGVVEHHPDVLLLVAGKGPLASRLQKLVMDLNLENHVKLVGYIRDEDLPFAYRAANLSIVPSLNLEGFGLIAAESLAAGTPVLVTPVGGLPEVVQALSKELILEGTTPIDLRNGICKAVGAKVRLPSRKDCQNYAKSNFGWAPIMSQIKLVYGAALQ
jgi:glycosyltransferase involved in cell wall biosynthesis